MPAAETTQSLADGFLILDLRFSIAPEIDEGSENQKSRIENQQWLPAAETTQSLGLLWDQCDL